jgi:hypothetical protein
VPPFSVSLYGVVYIPLKTPVFRLPISALAQLHRTEFDPEVNLTDTFNTLYYIINSQLSK